jgi:WD40 repeat protein
MNCISINESGSLLAGGTRLGKVHLWRNEEETPYTRSWKDAGSHTVGSASVDCMVFNPIDSSYLATCGAERGVVKLWDVTRSSLGSNPTCLTCPMDQAVLCVCAHYTGNFIAAGGSSGYTTVYDVRTRDSSSNILANLKDKDDDNIIAVKYSSDGDSVVVANSRGVVAVYDTRTWECYQSFANLSSSPCLGLAVNEEYVSTVSADGVFRTWDTSGDAWSMFQLTLTDVIPTFVVGLGICSNTKRI